MNQLVTEARALCRDATPGPWIAPTYKCESDAALMKRSRTLIPEMADEIERLQAELDAANDLISRAAVWLDLHKVGGIDDVLREFKKHLAAMKEALHADA